MKLSERTKSFFTMIKKVIMIKKIKNFTILSHNVEIMFHDIICHAAFITTT